MLPYRAQQICGYKGIFMLYPEKRYIQAVSQIDIKENYC